MNRRSGAQPPREVFPVRIRLQNTALVGDGTLFAVNAGFGNVVVFLSVFKQSVTHMSGRARNLSVALQDLDWGLAAVAAGLILAFTAGSALSALVLPERDLEAGLPYGRIFLLEALLLAVAATLLVSDVEAGIYVAALSFGLQNGKATFYHGVVIRTSHITGIVTDLGVDIGMFLRKRDVPSERVLIKLGVLVGFIAGGVLGAIAFGAFGVAALYITAGFALIMAFVYWLWRRWAIQPATTG